MSISNYGDRPLNTPEFAYQEAYKFLSRIWSYLYRDATGYQYPPGANYFSLVVLCRDKVEFYHFDRESRSPVDKVAEYLRDNYSRLVEEKCMVTVQVLPLRRKPERGRGSGEDVEVGLYLFVDLDYKQQVSERPAFLCTEHGDHALECGYEENGKYYIIKRPSLKQVLKEVEEKTGLRPHIVVDSGGGYHLYFKLRKPVSVDVWRELQALLVERLGGDPHVKDPARVMRLPGSMNTRVNRACRVMAMDPELEEPSILYDHVGYTPEDIFSKLKKTSPTPPPTTTPTTTPTPRRPVRPQRVRVIPQIQVDIDYSGDIRVIDERKIDAVFDDYIVFVRKKRNSYYISIYRKNEKLENILKAEVASGDDVFDLDIDDKVKDRLWLYITTWDDLIEKKEAEIYAETEVKTVTRATDRELFARRLAEVLLKKKVIRTFVVKEKIEDREVLVPLGIYCYDKYYYECEDELKEAIERLGRGFEALEARITRWVIGEVLSRVERRTLTPYKPLKHSLLFGDKIFVWDKFIETKDLEASLIDPSPMHVVEHKIPWKINLNIWYKHREGLEKYIPPVTRRDVIEIFRKMAPKSFNAFLSWVKGPDDDEETALSKVVLLLEVIGYTLYPHEYPFHTAILLVGSGANGKTTYLKLIRTILGNRNVSSVNLRDLDPRYNKFAVADLWKKLANISSEPVKGVIDTTLFKQLTGEDPVRFERKFKPGFTGISYAKMIFSANELPQVAEDTYAFWRRWKVILFPNTFPEDPTFFEKTFTEEEIQAIIICALHAFRLALERKSFTEIGLQDPKEEWLRRSNPVYHAFKLLEEEGLIVFNRDKWVEQSDLYALYTRYLNKLHEEGEEIEIKPKKTVTEELQKLFGIQRVQVKRLGKKYNAYRGIGFKDWDKVRELLGELRTPREPDAGEVP